MMRKTKILQLLPELNASVIERNALKLAKFLVQSGYDSSVLSNGGSLQETLESEGSRHFTLPVHKKSLFSYRTVLKIRSLLLKEQFDIIHVRSRLSAWFVHRALEQFPSQIRPKLVATFNSYYSVDAYSELMSKGDALICPSASMKNFVLDNYPLAKKKLISLVYRGIDSRKFPYGFQPNPTWLQQWADESHFFRDKFTIAIPGSISSRKGHSDFLHILYYLKQDGIPVHGLIIGSVDSTKEDYFSRLKNSIRSLELSDDISILLDRTDLREIMSVSDLVVSCSMVPEAFDAASLMALSLGVPVIGYSHGVLKEHLKALYPYGMVEAYKKSTMRLKIREFYRLNQKPIPLKNDQFTTEQANNKVIEVYQKLLLS